MLPLAFDFLSPSTMLLLAVLAVLLYGERLPEVARGLGQAVHRVEEEHAGDSRPVRGGGQGGDDDDGSPAPNGGADRGARGGDGPEVRASAERAGGRGRGGLRGRLHSSAVGDNNRYEQGGQGVWSHPSARAFSSVGRALSSQGRSHRFESCNAHFRIFVPRPLI